MQQVSGAAELGLHGVLPDLDVELQQCHGSGLISLQAVRRLQADTTSRGDYCIQDQTDVTAAVTYRLQCRSQNQMQSHKGCTGESNESVGLSWGSVCKAVAGLLNSNRNRRHAS